MDTISSKGNYDWFEPLYANADENEAQIPWALSEPVSYLTQWLARTDIPAQDHSAAVVGCGLGNDAEALAAAGFTVTAFDISESAIAWAKKRFPNTQVNYVVADLFNLPKDWIGCFDVVFEFRTLQALPLSLRKDAIAQVASLPKPGGTLLMATYTRATDAAPESAPWPLSEKEIAWFEQFGLEKRKEERFKKKDSRFSDRVQIEYRKGE